MVVVALLLSACTGEAPPEPVVPVPGAVCPEEVDTSRVGTLPRTVVVVVADTTRRDFLGLNHPEWDITPRLDALAVAGTRLDHVQATRGLTAVALSSVQTGAYPRTHGVRSNGGATVEPTTPTLQEHFQAAGFRTYGYSANMCQLTEVGMDDTLCTAIADGESRTQAEADEALVPALLAAMDTRPVAEPAYVWLHLVDPHDPYVAHPTWFPVFHPEPYTGPLDPPDSEALRRVSDGEIPFTAEDARFLQAVYASQLRNTDTQIGLLLDGLAERGRLDDALVLFTMDHGEELGSRTTYFYHGCSAHQTVLDVSAILWGPGRVPAGELLARPVSAVDLAPTVLALVGLPGAGPAEGRSLWEELDRCVEPTHDVYFERGSETAGVISGDWKYVLDPLAGYGDCKDYSDEDPFPGQVTGLYDLSVDPLELDDRAAAEAEIATGLHRAVCAWVNAAPWSLADEPNALEHTCAPADERR